jgi:hypothetical protein
MTTQGLELAATFLKRLSGHGFATVFRVIAHLRDAPAVHPRGAVFSAQLTVDKPTAPVPQGSYSATVRLSKGAGTPDRCPDVLGIGLRIHRPGGQQPWDFLFSSAGQGRLTRWLPVPSGDWTLAQYGTLGPYEALGRRWWLMLTPDSPPTGHSSVAKLRYLAPSAFILQVSDETADWLPVGRLELQTPVTERIPLDPVLNHPSRAASTPPWLRELRGLAYRGSREGAGSLHQGTGR